MTDEKLKELVIEHYQGKEGEHISQPIISRKFKVNYNPSKRVFDTLKEEGYIQPGPKSTSVSTWVGLGFTDYDVEKAEGERIFNLTGTYPF